ncbi:MAG: hypothetical protein ACXVJO_16250, partial [Thermoanaerobaculia bacterium]
DERYLLPFAILTLVGCAFVRREWTALGMHAVILVYFLAFFALFLPTPRFRVPLIPIIVILAAGLPETVLALRSRMRGRAEVPA